MADTRHADHDPALVAALLDRTPDAGDATELALAKTWVATCAECANLHRDLLALATATRDRPTPTRTRDFRLTAADAARLATPPDGGIGEPSRTPARLSGVMTDTRDHATHDTLLVASLADRTIADTERAAAEAIVATCSLCATLHIDLVALSHATRNLPTPTRTRDYRLTPEDALRLRPGGWRRLVAAFGSSRDALSRPLAMGLTTLGLAGLLVATVPSILTGQGAGGTASTQERASATDSIKGAPAVGAAGDGATAPAGSPLVPLTASGAAAAVPSSDLAGAAESGREGIVNTGAGENLDVTNGIDPGDDLYAPVPDLGLSDTAVAADPSGLSTIVVVSGTLLIVGLGLFALRWSARRLGDD